MTGTSAQLRRGAAACLCAAALAGCGSSSGGNATANTSAATVATSTPTTTAASAASAAVITIKGFAFQTPASVSPGATVTVRNEDGTAHTVTADSGNAFDDQAGSGTSTFTAPSRPGSYPFHCTIHPFMHGTLVVK
jgi:plastocyanin